MDIVRFFSFCVLLGVFVRPSWSSTVYEHTGTRTFNYDRNRNDPFGVFNWPQTFPQSCSAPAQSPVNIETSRFRLLLNKDTCPNLFYTNDMIEGSFINNGHTAEFRITRGELEVSNLPNRPGLYIAHDFHVHYGGSLLSQDTPKQRRPEEIEKPQMTPGSEHTLNGRRYDGEIHFVLYNSKYGTLENAENKPDGIAVLAFFVTLLAQTTSSNLAVTLSPPMPLVKLPSLIRTSVNCSLPTNLITCNRSSAARAAPFEVNRVPEHSLEGLQARYFSQILCAALPRIRDINNTVNARISLKTFFDRKCEFFTYQGSTTTPQCFQSVQWVIFQEPIPVTFQAWSKLQALKSTGNFDARYGNYRPSQPLHDRIVEANFLPTGYILLHRRHSHTPGGQGEGFPSWSGQSRWKSRPSKLRSIQVPW